MASTPAPQRPIWIAKLKGQPGRCGHMMVYISNASCADTHPTSGNSSIGTVLQVVGALMLGFTHEFIRNYNISNELSGEPTVVLVGKVDAEYIRDPPTTDLEKTDQAYDAKLLDGIALKIAAPRKTENFLDPAQASKIRDCQDWVLDFITELVRGGILPDDDQAIQIVRENVDVQTGLALRSVNSLVGPPMGARTEGSLSGAQSGREPLASRQQQRAGWLLDEGTGKWIRRGEAGDEGV